MQERMFRCRVMVVRAYVGKCIRSDSICLMYIDVRPSEIYFPRHPVQSLSLFVCAIIFHHVPFCFWTGTGYDILQREKETGVYPFCGFLMVFRPDPAIAQTARLARYCTMPMHDAAEVLLGKRDAQWTLSKLAET
jgi:hypothetical protein